jgi:hypothetical protein
VEKLRKRRKFGNAGKIHASIIIVLLAIAGRGSLFQTRLSIAFFPTRIDTLW